MEKKPAVITKRGRHVKIEYVGVGTQVLTTENKEIRILFANWDYFLYLSVLIEGKEETIINLYDDLIDRAKSGVSVAFVFITENRAEISQVVGLNDLRGFYNKWLQY